MRVLVVAGETCSPSLIEQWSNGRTMVNAYGPTETTVCASMEVGVDGTTGPAPIGTPLPGLELYVLDRGLRPVAVRAPGTVRTRPGGGTRLSRRPGQTSERFVACPEGPPGSVMYRTGDLVRRTTSDTLLFAGRSDEQVKVRGHRIEPGEVERFIETFPGIGQAVVIVRADHSGGSLEAFVTPDGAGGSVDVDRLTSALTCPGTGSGPRRSHSTPFPRPQRQGRPRTADRDHRNVSPTGRPVEHLLRQIFIDESR